MGLAALTEHLWAPKPNFGLLVAQLFDILALHGLTVPDVNPLLSQLQLIICCLSCSLEFKNILMILNPLPVPC